MGKFSNLGATALALALSITMLVPLNARAYVETENEKGERDWLYTVYTDSDTGIRISHKDYDINRSGAISKSVSVLYLTTKAYTSHSFYTGADSAKFTNFRSNSKNLKVIIQSRDETTYGKKEQKPDYDYKKKSDGTCYFKDVYGNLQTVASEDKCPINTASGSYSIRFFAKKSGTYKFSYDVLLENGSTVTKTYKVIAKADGSPYKSITFAGQKLNSNPTAKPSQDLWHKGNISYSNKSKGKFKVRMNKGFVLQKLEIGYPNVRVETVNNKYSRKEGTYISSRDDMSNSLTVWKTIKNGSTIKLNNFNDNSGDYNYTYYNSKHMKSETSILETDEFFAYTPIRITYYDKQNDITYRSTISISRKRRR